MLQLVNTGHKALADYATIATRGLMDEIRRLAEPLAGKRVLALSATAFGGGVAEIQYTLVPLMQDAGLEVEWRIIHGADEFFDVTKTIHNALQGNPRGLTGEQRACFARYQRLNAEEIDADAYDFVVVHDPQPIGVIDHLGGGSAKWIWRGHIDFSTPNADVFDFLLPSLRRYDAAIFHMADYVPRTDGLPPCVIWPPAIDPLAPKNMALASEDASYIVDQFGIDISRPLLTQVSRFDPWKDPLGVIDAYRVVKEQHPDVQLALVGSMAHDDPEGWDYYERTVAHAGGDPDVFGLTVAEALWKVRPTVAGAVGGIVTQIRDGETGWLVDSPEACAAACLEIIADPAAARIRALAGKEHVRRNFLTPRLLRDWLSLFNRLLGNQEAGVLDIAA